MIDAVIVSILIILATAENFLPYIIGYLQTPDQYVFLGTVHYPADYFYYLSQFAQGSYRFLTTINLFSGNQATPTLVGWSNVLTGKLFSLVGVSPVVAYHSSVVIFTMGVLASGYLLAQKITLNKTVSLLTLYLFTIFHAFPILRDGKPSYGDYWNNFAVPRVRLGGVPHQLLLNIASILMIYFVLSWLNTRRSVKPLIGVGFMSLVLASLQPVLWMLVSGAIILSVVIYRIIRNRSRTTPTSGSLPTPKLIPLIITLAASGLPPIYYLTRIFSTLPFTQLKLWEAQQQTPLTIEHFISATGPVLLIAILTIPLYLARINFARLLVTVFSLLSILLFLSPVPKLLGVSQVRLMSTLTILFLSSISASGMYSFISLHTTASKVLGSVLIVGLSLIMLPNHVITIRLASAFAHDNAYIYLPVTQYKFLQAAGAMGRTDETYLIAWPYNELFPAVTGKRTYNGHPLITIQAQQKDDLAAKAFEGSMAPEAMRDFFVKNHIAYVIATADNRFMGNIPFLTQKLASNSLVLYAVH